MWDLWPVKPRAAFSVASADTEACLRLVGSHPRMCQSVLQLGDHWLTLPS